MDALGKSGAAGIYEPFVAAAPADAGRAGADPGIDQRAGTVGNQYGPGAYPPANAEDLAILNRSG